MSVAPSPSSGRGEVILQPAYFTSSVFVHAARTDVDCLIREYSRRYTRSNSRSHPFTLFKDVWQELGWTWIQFKVFDTRSRAAFLKVMMRLFSEHFNDGEAPLRRAVALFGLYTIFRTQPSTPAPSLYYAAQVELTCDTYEEMLMLPDALDGEFLLPIQSHVVYVLSDLLEARVFQILPHAELGPLGPRVLPREVVAEDAGVMATSTAEGRKKGRPSKRERVTKTRDSLIALDRWCKGGHGDVLGSPPSATRNRYAMEKSALLGAVSRDERWSAALAKANGAVVERMAAIGRRCS